MKFLKSLHLRSSTLPFNMLYLYCRLGPCPLHRWVNVVLFKSTTNMSPHKKTMWRLGKWSHWANFLHKIHKFKCCTGWCINVFRKQTTRCHVKVQIFLTETRDDFMISANRMSALKVQTQLDNALIKKNCQYHICVRAVLMYMLWAWWFPDSLQWLRLFFHIKPLTHVIGYYPWQGFIIIGTIQKVLADHHIVVFLILC